MSVADDLAARLGDGAPANIALMHLLMASATPEAADAALADAAVRHPRLAEALAEVGRLLAAHPDAWRTVHAVADGVDHAPALASAEATLDHWRASFDRLAEAAPEAGVALYALGDPALLAAATDEVVAVLEAWGLLGHDRDALDLGCGMGRFAEALAPHLRSVLGLDLSPGMVAEARRRSRHAGVRYAVGTGRDLAGVADASVDLVLAADVFPYLVEAGLAGRHVAEIARVLRPGGAAVLLNYSYRGDAARDRADLADAAAAEGLALERAGERPFRLWDAGAFLLRRGRSTEPGAGSEQGRSRAVAGGSRQPEDASPLTPTAPPADRPEPLGARVSRLVFGGFLATHGSEERKLGTFEAVPAMGLDGLGSSAYGPEAALTVLLPLGAGGLAAVGPIMLLLVALLAVLYASYRQTVLAYPSNGGAYTVAQGQPRHGREPAGRRRPDGRLRAQRRGRHLGRRRRAGFGRPGAGPLHAGAVPRRAGSPDAGEPARHARRRPALRPADLPVHPCASPSSSSWGTWAAVSSGGHPVAVVAPPAVPAATETLGLWLFLRAFASGCTAMTGVEAVSNGVSAFRGPVVARAHNTLTVIVVTLGFLLVGIGYLARAYGIDAMDQGTPGYQSVLSQLVGAVAGRGWFYDVAIGSLLCILCLSANTSFVDFPRLCRLVARDGFLPRPFAVAGRRLVYSVGVLYLAATAALLLVAFGGITDRLIPLFAIGAFLTFTLSQAGMVVHWWRDGGGRIGLRLGVNALGAATTGVALAVILAAKFVEGAWITVLAIPLVIVLLRGIHGYYARLDGQLRDDEPLALGPSEAPLVLVATRGWDRLTDKAVRFALQISPDVIAVHLLDLDGEDDEGAAQRLRDAWERDVAVPARAAGLNPPRLMLLRATFRRIHAPLLRLVERLRREQPDRTVAVLVPTVAKTHLWQHLLHTHNAARLSQALMRFGGEGVVVVNIPWHLEAERVDDALIPEERRGEDAAA